MPSELNRSMLCALVAALLAGCTTTRTTIDNSAVQQFPAAESTLDFWDALDTQSVTTNDDALHALILVNDGDDGLATTWDERLARARELGWLPQDDPAPIAAESAQVGLIAVAAVHMLDIKGGLSMAMWGRTPRYSVKELVHIGVLPGIGEHEALSGAEFIAFIDALEQRQLIDAAWRRRLHPDAGAVEPFTGRAPEADPLEPAEQDDSPQDGPQDAPEASQKDDQS